MRIEHIEPTMIEAKSFEIITEILGERVFDKENVHVIKRCIHTSADFDYADNLYFSKDAVKSIATALKNGACIVTDTQMVKAGINKKLTAEFGVEIHCFIADEDIAAEASRRNITRAAVSMEKAAALGKPVVFAVGNAPTALLKLDELIKDNGFKPSGIIAVPVGFVNVVESKEVIIKHDIPCIAALGRKGGSNIAAAICNAILTDTIKGLV